MSGDILHRLRTTNQNPDIQFSAILYNEAMVAIEDMCLEIVNKALWYNWGCQRRTSHKQPFDCDLQR